MKLIKSFKKDADERLDYQVDFDELLQADESIVSHVVETSDAAILHSHSAAARAVTLWLQAGTPQQGYTVTVRVTTNSSPARIFERSIGLEIAA